jgi:hypothetical protein
MSTVSTIIVAFGRMKSRVVRRTGLTQVGAATEDRSESSREARGRV